MRSSGVIAPALLAALGSCALPAGGRATRPLVVGETFTLDSAALHETRRVNVFAPTVYGEPVAAPMGVLCLLDGGVNEDFLHIAGLVEVLVSDGSMRPFLVVGIENTQRRRDLTGPTENAEDRKIAPVVGGSAVFRRFLRDELLPEIRRRYRTSGETAVAGESLAGLFVVETLLLEPGLFDDYVAVDPSLWWADHSLVDSAEGRLAALPPGRRAVFLANSSEPSNAPLTARLAETLRAHPESGLATTYLSFPNETHATVFHPAALVALRTLLAPR